MPGVLLAWHLWTYHTYVAAVSVVLCHQEPRCGEGPRPHRHQLLLNVCRDGWRWCTSRGGRRADARRAAGSGRGLHLLMKQSLRPLHLLVPSPGRSTSGRPLLPALLRRRVSLMRGNGRVHVRRTERGAGGAAGGCAQIVWALRQALPVVVGGGGSRFACSHPQWRL